MYWWAYPSRIFLFILLPMYLGCAALDSNTYPLLFHQPVKYITGNIFWLGILAIGAFMLGALYAEPRKVTHAAPGHIPPDALNKVFVYLYGITLTAYAIFFFPVLSHPSLVRELAGGSTSAMYELRETLNKIPGITSLVALQSLCVLLYFGYTRFTGYRPPREFFFLMVAMVGCAALRAWLWSERIALMEVLLPIVVMKIAIPHGRKQRWLILAPLFGFLGVFILFCVGEYFRSWQTYQSSWNGTFFDFAFSRFLGYFATSVNNGALILHYIGPIYTPTNTVIWFYKFPLWPLLDITFTPKIAYDTPAVAAMLYVFGNPEYNNPCGIFMPFYDYGYLGGTVLWVLLGWFTGSLLKKFVNGETFGMLLYPVWYIGVLESLRVFYWGDSRFFPVVLVIILVNLYLKKRSLPSNAALRPDAYQESLL